MNLRKASLFLFLFSVFFSYAQDNIEISVPFSSGAIGTIGTNTQKNNDVTMFESLDLERAYFSQTVSSTSGIFSAQGNDIPGSLILVFTNDERVVIDGAIIWRTNDESFGFLAKEDVSFNLNEYGSVSKIITGGMDDNTSPPSSNFSLLRNDRSWSYVNTDDISGNAAGVIDDLNLYLGISNSNKPSGPITVNDLITSDTTPIISGTASISTSTERLEIIVNNIVYAWDSSYTSEINYDPTSGEWSIQIAGALNIATYDVDAFIYNADDYFVSDLTSNELQIIAPDTTDPIILDQTFTYAENQAANYAIGTVSATDSNTLTYSIESGTYSSSFAINSSTGAITLTNVGSTSSAPSNDYETDPNSFSLVVRVTDPSSNTATGTITINVTDVDDTDPVILDQTFTYAENQAANYAIGTVSATDNNTLTYSIESGTYSSSFAINSSTGAITLTNVGSTSSAPSNDYETDPNSFSLVVRVTDPSSNTATGTITINVTDVDDTDPVILDQTFTYAESQAANYAIGSVSATDSNTLTYAFETGENPDGFFAINSSTGAITLTSTGSASSAASNDYATTPNSFSLIVKVTDLASNTATGTITINVTEVDNTAPVLADQTFTYAESQAANYAIGTVSATDSNTLTYAFETGENSDGFFAINSSSGAITLTSTGSTSSAASNDYETIPNSFSLIVKVTDPSSNTTTGTITINVTDVSEIIDDDQDGLPNGEELELGTDPFDADTDGDGVLDGTEVTDGTNPLDVCDYVSAHITQVQKEAWLNADCDSDGLTNKEEKDLGTDPKNADTDGDGVLDGTEVTDGTDPLNLCDFVLIHQTLTPSQEWSEADCDKDGLTNEKEKELGTDPKNPDTDGDGVLDSTEVIDGTDPLDLCDFILSHQTLTPSDDWNTVDCDEDGLTNEKEKELGADPRNPDTDGDGVVDGTEVTDTTNLFDHCDFILTSQTVATKSEWNNADCDNDGATNGEEMEYGSNPLDKDSDKDGVLDGTELTDVTDALDGCSLILEHQTILANINMWNMLDCDNDSIPNGEEIKEDTDNDGLFNFLDSDDDNDGIPTIEEFPNANKNAFGDIAMDANNNNIPDYLETNNFNPNEEDGIEVYNALTPNGDGVHDIFTIRNISIYPDNELRVYNRWGKLVYEMKGYGSNGRYFSGTSNLGAQRLSSGTYFYVLNYKDANAQNKTREGYLYLNR